MSSQPQTEFDDENAWIQTYNGGLFHPIRPVAEEVNIIDIAHSLSMICRFTGHVQRFYSVAEHCIHISEWAYRHDHMPREVQLVALLHDASEAYIADLARPVKWNLPEYTVIEDRLMNVIWRAFGLHPTEDQMKYIKSLDNRILQTEYETLMGHIPEIDWGFTPGEGLPIDIDFMSPGEAERKFLQIYERIITRGLW